MFFFSHLPAPTASQIAPISKSLNHRDQCAAEWTNRVSRHGGEEMRNRGRIRAMGRQRGIKRYNAARELSAVTAGLFMSARAALFYWFAGA